MRSLTRLLLVWIVALALPMQGLAASTMLFCPPQHRAGQPHGDGHDHAGAAAHAAMHADHDAGATPGQDAGGTGDESACSVCAACCTGVAITAPANQPALIDMSARYGPALAVPHAGFTTAGLDRPPRHLLA